MWFTLVQLICLLWYFYVLPEGNGYINTNPDRLFTPYLNYLAIEYVLINLLCTTGQFCVIFSNLLVPKSTSCLRSCHCILMIVLLCTMYSVTCLLMNAEPIIWILKTNLNMKIIVYKFGLKKNTIQNNSRDFMVGVVT